MTAALEWLAPATNGEGAAQEWLAAGVVTAPESAEPDEATTQQWIQGMGSGAASGLAMGAAGGPWGLAIGAVIGAILGALQTAMQPDEPAAGAPAEPKQPPSTPPPHIAHIAGSPPAGASGSPDVIGQIVAMVPGVADLLKRPVVATSTAPAQPTTPPPLAHDESGEAIDDYGIDEAVPEVHAARGPIVVPDYPLAARFEPASPDNYEAGSGSRDIRRVVIHITDSGPAISETINWFQDPTARVSAHYVIGQDGEIVQMVRHDDIAWHARGANRDSIGIEHVANTRGLVPTVIEYVSSAGLVRWLCDEHSIPIDRQHIVGHSEVAQTNHVGCPNAVWDWDYYMRLVNGAVSMPREP